MQNYWSFKAGSSNTLIKSIKYITLTTFNYLVNTYGFFVLYRTFEFENLVYTKIPIFPQIFPEGFLVKIIITALIMSWNFFLFKYWVFKVKTNPQNEQ
jgi:putative flippase GtrA